MKKLYTLMLAAASATMMFAQMPIMQQTHSFGSLPEPKQVPTEKTGLVNRFNQFKSENNFKAFNKQQTRFNAPSRAEGKVTRDDLVGMHFVQDYSTFLQNASGPVEVEFCGDLYFTAGKGENDIVMTGLFGYQNENSLDLSVYGTFDPETQTMSFPFEQRVYKNSSQTVYFSGFGFLLTEDKTDVVDTFDYTDKDSLVLAVENFYGQYIIQVEGASDNSWDVIPAFGFLLCDAKGEPLGWLDLTVGETFYVAQANAKISYQYVHKLDNTGQNYEILDYDGYGLLNIGALEQGGDTAIQIGPFVQTRFGCPVMFQLDYGQYAAYDTFIVGKKEYPNPAYFDMGEDQYFYLCELTDTSIEMGVYLNVYTDENNVFESAEFDGLGWCAYDEVSGYWWGECLPAVIEPIEFEFTGIDEIATDKVADQRWFNLQGIEVNKDKLQKGNIYINSGKKVLVK